jgi:hypothetical protein
MTSLNPVPEEEKEEEIFIVFQRHLYLSRRQPTVSRRCYL